MSLRDSSIIVLEVGARRTLISREAAQGRAQDGLGVFDGNVKIHRSLERTAIPDANGRCRYCNEGACRPLRVSHMTSRAASRRASDPWKVMRVKANRRGRKRNLTASIERELNPRRIAAELRELSSEPPLTGAFFEKFTDPDKLVRQLELEKNTAFVSGGPTEAAKLDLEGKKLFVGILGRLETQPGYARHIAEYVAKLRRVVFPLAHLELEELKQIVGPGQESARRLQVFLDDITDQAAEFMVARDKAFADLRVRRNLKNRNDLDRRLKNSQ